MVFDAGTLTAPGTNVIPYLMVDYQAGEVDKVQAYTLPPLTR